MSQTFAAKAVVTPTVLIAICCFYIPIVWTIYVSFTDSTLFPNYQFGGLGQYFRLFATLRWRIALSNMVLLTVLFVSMALVIGTFLAIVLDQKIKLEGVFRTVLLYPLSMSFIVTGLAWQWFFNPSMGLQDLVRHYGWTDFRFDWIVQRNYAIYTIIFAAVWHSSGLVMAIMLAGLRNVDGDMWHAARVDGIPRWRTYVSIVLPMLRPVVVTCVVLLLINAVRSYDLVIAMTQGGPGNATDVPGKYVVDMAFDRGNIGQASAAAVVMLASVLVVLLPYFHYENKGSSR